MLDAKLDVHYGCLPESLDVKLFGLFDIDNIPFRKRTFEDAKYAYNQWMTMYCTVYSHLTNIANTFNKNFTTEEIKECVDYCIKEAEAQGHNLPKDGWWLAKAAEAVRVWYTKKYNHKIEYFGVLIDTPMFYELLVKGYIVSTGIYYNSEYVKDVYDNGSVDRKDYETFGNLNIGHALNMYRSEKWTGIIQMIDNRNGNKYNVYSLQDVTDLKRDGVLFNTGYIWYSEEEPITRFVDKKLTARFNNTGKYIINAKTWEYALVVNNKKVSMNPYITAPGRKFLDVEAKLVVGVTQENWDKIGE